MTFFNVTEPIIRRKQTALDLQDLCGLLKINIEVGNNQLFSRFYTRIDQALLLWGGIAFIIFTTAQFLPISWITQAYFWSILTLVATGAMVVLTRFWTKIEQLSWVTYLWGGLMLFSLVLTNLGIFASWGIILMNLCSLWLGSCAFGYFLTGLGLKSRLFILIGLIHLLTITVLPIIPGWQFLTTGLVIASSLVLLSEVQWDMREAMTSPVLSETEQAFNWQQRQQRKRKSSCTNSF